jgi:PAS domain S-box-containing protein
MDVSGSTSSESLCKWIFENAEFGLIIIDEEQRIVDINRWIENKSGQKDIILRGKPILDVFPEIKRRSLDHYLSEALNGASVILSARFHSHFIEFKDESGEGEMKQTVRIIPINDHERVNGLIIQIEDVTDRWNRETLLQKKNEELQKLNSTKDKFFRIIAHDLKSPFTALLGFSEILKDNIDDLSSEQSKEIVNILHSSLKDQFSFLENLLKWSQLQSGHFELTYSHVQVESIINNILKIADAVIKCKNIEIKTSVPDGLSLYTDAQALTSILYNIVFNALKFTSDYGKVAIFVNEDDESVSFAIEDNGMGMPPERVGKLFMIGESVSTLGTNREKGSGLGLILVKELIDKLKGDITVDSAQGIGTTFHISIPKHSEGKTS